MPDEELDEEELEEGSSEEESSSSESEGPLFGFTDPGSSYDDLIDDEGSYGLDDDEEDF